MAPHRDLARAKNLMLLLLNNDFIKTEMPMKSVLFCLLLLFSCLYLVAQNIGIGTTLPQTRLHVVNNFEILRLQGVNPYISFFNNSGGYTGYLSNRNNSSIDLGTPVGSNSPVTISPGLQTAATFLPSGNVGFGVANPLYRLDISGRLFIRPTNPETAGLFFRNSLNTSNSSVTLYSDNIFGFLASGAGVGLQMNTNTGNIRVGYGSPNASKFAIGATSANDALEITGGIKVSGTNRAAFQLVASSSNTSSDKHSIIIDHPFANGDPNALVFISALNYNTSNGLSVFYDPALAKWTIRHGTYRANGFSVGGGEYQECDGERRCWTVRQYLTGTLHQGFNEGLKLNIIIIKQ